MNEIHSSKNVVTARIDADENVIVGDGNNITVINLKEAAQYKAIEAEIQELNERFEKVKQKSIQYPDDPDFTVELIAIDSKRSERQKELETLKQEVIKLAEDFARIPINTERLKKAKVHFENGEFATVRAVLNAEQMELDLDTIIQREDLGKAIQEQAKEDRKNLANEYLILARLTATDFELPDRFEKTVEYFEQSLQAERNGENIFAYAYFLGEHNHNIEATPLYQEALRIYRSLAQSNPQTFLPYVANTLNNLALLHQKQNELEKAETEYQEALGIYMSLVKSNPQVFLPIMATTLNNLAVLHQKQNELEKAEGEYQEALRIRRYLAQINPETVLPNVANTLNNLANLHNDKKELKKAEEEYSEALGIYRSLAQINPQGFLLNVAMTLNNLANLHSDKNELEKADEEYQEALGIYRSLAQLNPQTFLPVLAQTLNNLALFHCTKKELEKAEREYEEALQIRRSLAQSNPQAFLRDVAETLNNLAIFHSEKNELEKVEGEFEEALGITRFLAHGNPQTFLPDVAMTASNMAVFFQGCKPDRQRSLELVKESIKAGMPFLEVLPRVQNYMRSAIIVIQKWGLDLEEFLKKMDSE